MFCCVSCFVLVTLLCVLSALSCQVSLLLWLGLPAPMCFTCVDCPTCVSLSACVYSLCFPFVFVRLSVAFPRRCSHPLVLSLFPVSASPSCLVSRYVANFWFCHFCLVFVFLALFWFFSFLFDQLNRARLLLAPAFVLSVCILGPLLFKTWQFFDIRLHCQNVHKMLPDNLKVGYDNRA